MLWGRVMLPLLCLSHCLLLHHLMQPNLTLAIHQSFYFQSLFSQHWWPKQIFLKFNSRRSGITHVLPWETKWPQIKKGDYNGLFLTSIHILSLQIKGSETIACKITRLSQFVVLEVIIRMALLKERSKILCSVLGQCYFTQKECFLGMFPLSFGLLHWNVLKIDWTILFIEQMDKLPIRHSPVWIKSRLMFQPSILLVVLAMSWMTVFNLASQWFQNDNHWHKWVCTLEDHPHMLQMLHWFLFCIL